MVEPAVPAESARWGDNRNPDDAPYTREAWVAERDRLIGSYFPERTGVLLAQLREDGLYHSTYRGRIEALQRHHNNRGKTAAFLGINKSTLWRKMKKYNIE